MNYLVVLFKNREKRKIINKFKTKKKALDFYNKLISESNNVIFNKNTENGLECFFELVLLESKDLNQGKVYIKDELGRTILVKTDSEDYNILKISNYNIEEEFVDYSTKQKITSLELEKKYLNKSGIKLVSKLNNKIVVQNDEKINLFTFKTLDDADRFITKFETYYNNKKKDCIFVKDYSFPQRKYMYELLINYGFPKSYLQRYSTAHPVKK